MLPTASIGKVLLLAEVAAQLVAGTLRPDELLVRAPQDVVADSGLWQHLTQQSLSVPDLATLVGAVSDNLATNVLLRRVGLAAVAGRTAALGLRSTALHDRVRDRRTPADPPLLSSGTAAELAAVMAAQWAGAREGDDAALLLLGWLANGADLSMVAAALGLDPLAHGAPDRGLQLVHKTGADPGVRAEVGVLTGPAGALAYAVIAHWDEPANEQSVREEVLGAMREVGAALRAQVTGDRVTGP